MLTSLRGPEDHQAYRRVFWFNIGLNACVALAVAVVVWLLSGFIMARYGVEFIPGDKVLTVLAMSAVLLAVNNVIGQAIASHGRMWLGFLFNLAWGAVLILSSYLLLKRGYGALGVALANLIAYLCHSIWQGVFVIRLGSRFQPKITRGESVQGSD